MRIINNHTLISLTSASEGVTCYIFASSDDDLDPRCRYTIKAFHPSYQPESSGGKLHPPTFPTITMAMAESSKRGLERSGRNRDNTLGEATMQASGLIISLVQEAASYAPSAELQKAATVALIIFQTIQV